MTLTNTVADFVTVFTPPDVTTDADFGYQVTITVAGAQTAVAITTNFTAHVKPRAAGRFATGTKPSVLFNPVILSLNANGSETAGTVKLVADVSDDSAPDHLSFQWSFVPNMGTANATFASNGQGNPGVFQGYTVDHQGTITLAVTDENNGTTTLHYQLKPGQFGGVIVPIPITGVKRIAAGDAHTCVITGQDRVRCWGDNQFGQLGYGNAVDVGDAGTRLPFTAGDVPFPVDPMTQLPFDPVVQLVAGNNHTCVLQASGVVYCWGDNRFGQLGYNRTDNLADGEPVTSFGTVTLGGIATRIAAGGDHTCAVLQGGALRCWGRNDFGQLGRGNTANIGDNETVDSAGNVDLGAGISVKDLALGSSHTCALLTTGAVRCWGRNSEGQLGYGNATTLGDNEPINNLPNVSLTGTVRKLVAGEFHTCALTMAGTLRCWGGNGFGQLGQNMGAINWGDQANEFPSTLPSDIITGAPVTDVAAGDDHTCALSSDGQLKCWGRGEEGELGYGSVGTGARLGAPPAAGVNLDGVTSSQITAGLAHTCALRSNSSVRCWGFGGDGRLGRGNTATSATATGNVNVQIFSPAPACGDGHVDPGEQCDDGNSQRRRLRQQLHAARCGDGIVERRRAVRRRQHRSTATAATTTARRPSAATASSSAGEQCDDGNAKTATPARTTARCPAAATGSSSPASSATTATRPTATPARTTAPRLDAATGSPSPASSATTATPLNGDACNTDCTDAPLRDGVVDPDEACDDGNMTTATPATTTASRPACGDGALDPGEQCDDGNTANSDACENDCTAPRCGDGIVDRASSATMATRSTAMPARTTARLRLRQRRGQTRRAVRRRQRRQRRRLRNDCTLPRCGDGIVERGEQCDDGNAINGDACGPPARDPGRAATASSSRRAVRRRQHHNGDGCANDCTTAPRCGDGIVEAGEQCDDGNTTTATAATTNCKPPAAATASSSRRRAVRRRQRPRL